VGVKDFQYSHDIEDWIDNKKKYRKWYIKTLEINLAFFRSLCAIPLMAYTTTKKLIKYLKDSKNE
jgi:hypothetical protein